MAGLYLPDGCTQAMLDNYYGYDEIEEPDFEDIDPDWDSILDWESLLATQQGVA